jgi:hypothetical protein
MSAEYLDVMVKVLGAMTTGLIGFLTWYVKSQKDDAKERRELEQKGIEVTRQLAIETTDAIRSQVELSREHTKALEALTQEVREASSAIKVMVARIETRDQAKERGAR